VRGRTPVECSRNRPETPSCAGAREWLQPTQISPGLSPALGRGDRNLLKGNTPRIPRGLLNLSIYLPFGSEAGRYHLTIYKHPAKPLLSTTGTAIIR